MTNEQPTALRLADELHQKHNGEGLLAYCEAELRRLHAENEAAHAVGIRQEQELMDCEALLRQAAAMLATMPVKHPQQGQERDALLEVIKERLK